MPATCPHCQRAFSATRGIFGQDAEQLRDVHASACAENPRNKCFCGRVFPNSAARDNHATACEMNPMNRFKCPHCPQEFVTRFGVTNMFSSDGRALRDAHVVGCKDNPANKCFCGQVFTNADARNAHAVRCEMNPANCFQCQFCDSAFVTTFSLLGFRGSDGRAARDAHQIGCDKNPKNHCFCGSVFPNPAARDKHALACESNPANRFGCPHCERIFITRYGIMGLVVSDGKASRDSHEMGCERNPANVCFCGQRFSNPALRDAHAAKCDANPVNRFTCKHCQAVFVTKFGIFTTLGSVERDAHAASCRMNPVNAACEHCNATFKDTRGWVKWLDVDAHTKCEAHKSCCQKNPRNRCQCDHCGRCFSAGKGWFSNVDPKVAREAHMKMCDVIPCTYEVVETDADWQILAEECDSSAAINEAERSSSKECGLREGMVYAETEDFLDAESVDGIDVTVADDAQWQLEDADAVEAVHESTGCQEAVDIATKASCDEIPVEEVGLRESLELRDEEMSRSTSSQASASSECSLGTGSCTCDDSDEHGDVSPRGDAARLLSLAQD